MGVNTLFLDAVWGPLDAHGRSLYGELRMFKKGATPNQAFVRDTTEAMKIALMSGVAQREDVYFGVLRRTTTRGRAEDTVEATHLLWADFDAKNYRGKTGSGSAFAEIANMRLIPHIIVDSGHGYHAYWLLDTEYEFADAQKVMKGIERVHRTDHCSDAARILRVPGTLNFKDASPTPVRLVRFDVATRPYSLDAFNEYAYQPVRNEPMPRYKGGGEWTPSSVDVPKFGEGQRNNGLARVAAAMVHKGLSPEDVVATLFLENTLRCDPPLEDDEVVAIAKSVERYRDE